ncbi:MAG: LysR substrate-binding domain-containing protein, partial [Myxococcota bacterium]
LTDAGNSLLHDARTIVSHAEQLNTRAREIAGGIEAQISLAVDVMFPMPVLLDTLRDFRAEYPRVSLRLYTEALGAVVNLVESRRCQLGISTPLPTYPSGMNRSPMLRFPMVTVCAPDHPLALEPGPVPARVLQEHNQLVLTDRSPLTEGVDMGVVSGQSWRLADLSAKHALLNGGFGWGSMPRHLVEEDLGRGELVQIETETLAGLELTLVLVRRESDWVGPATQWLIDHLKDSCQRFEQQTRSLRQGQTEAHPRPSGREA